jgi:drug/metabolite transporter (DMT)-like permease
LFGLSATAIRSASITLLGTDTITRSLVILAITTSLQFLFLASLLVVREPRGFAAFFRAWRLAAAVGLASVAGSAGWFTAMTLQKAAYVQVVGQIEIVLSLLVSRLMFRERIAPLELIATILFVGGLVLLLLTGET